MSAVEFTALRLAHDRRELWRVVQTGLIVGGVFSGKMPKLMLSPFHKERETKPDMAAMEKDLIAGLKAHNARQPKKKGK